MDITTEQKLKEQEQLVAVLKFTPRTYTVMLSGYGGEIVLGSVPREQYQYFVDNKIDIEQFAWDEDYADEVPEDMQPFTPGSWHECSDVAHESGCELSDYNVITVTDENGKQHWQSNLGYAALAAAGIEIDQSDEYLCSDRADRANTVGFIGQSTEKGCFFEGELELTTPFDSAKLAINYNDIEGWSLISSVTYDGVDIEGHDGYSTRGKGSEFKFYDTDFSNDASVVNEQEKTQ
tara:strand:+ start:1759 stop:2463 length:705 start_codon:yes stop_codon:yes gene_type:complete